jgi:antitoxin (DNA-binding transcriptional repressor) of toxin-antitoxin stability system
MKTLTITEATGNLAGWLKRAVAGEEIVIRSDNVIVALRPLPPPKAETASPRKGRSVQMPDFMARLRARRSRRVFSAEETRRLIQDSRGDRS